MNKGKNENTFFQFFPCRIFPYSIAAISRKKKKNERQKKKQKKYTKNKKTGVKLTLRSRNKML